MTTTRTPRTLAIWIMAVLATATFAAVVPVRTVHGATGSSGSVDWAACGPRLECATVPVPLDWAHPRRRTITLAVTRHLGSHPEARIGSLFVNPGGPGESGVDMVVARGDALDAITDGRFDIVGWDLRGTHRSTPANCFASSDERAAFWQGLAVPTTPGDEQIFLARAAEMARRCGERNGSLLAHITTADTARDLDHLRRLVGDPQLNFLGESAGTYIGQTYANMFPKRVRAMALDGVFDAVEFAKGTATAIGQGLDSVDAEFEQFLALCEQAGDEACPVAATGQVQPQVEALLAGLRQQPIPAPSATPPGELTYGDMLSLIKFALLPHPDLWRGVGVLLAQAIAGDASMLEDLANGYAAELTRRQFETNTVLLCGDSPARQKAKSWPHVVDKLERISRLGAAPMGWVIASPCASWPVQGANRYTGPWNAATTNPILLIGTRFDPNTPLVNAQRAERRLGNAVLLTHDGYGHLSESDPSTCVHNTLRRYLVELIPPAKGTVCPSDRLPFDPNFGQPLPSASGA